jgi:N-acetylglutamate synthase-like GNAT family acetyltransferase
MQIRKATLDDFAELYAFGMATPELRVSALFPFMLEEEFSSAITSPASVFLVAEEQGIKGFVYAKVKEGPTPQEKIACIVYIAAKPETRGQGAGSALEERCIQELKARGVGYVYMWANADTEDTSIIRFAESKGYAKGPHKYIWMDRII